MPSWVAGVKETKGGHLDVSPHFFPYILFKILLARDVQADTALTERLGFNLVGRAWNGGNYDIGDCQAIFKGELGRVCDVMSVEPVSSGGTRAGSFGVFLRRWLRFQSLGGDEGELHTWMESISTENTRAPSFANKAARGRPTTSDLQRFHSCRSPLAHFSRLPIDDSDNPSISPVPVRQDAVIHSGMFEAFHDREWCAWKDRFGRPRWRLIVDGYRDFFC